MQLQTVMLCLRHDFYNIIFKIKHKLYIASGSAPLPKKNSGCAPGFSRKTASWTSWIATWSSAYQWYCSMEFYLLIPFVRLPVAARVSGRGRPSVADDGRTARWSCFEVCGLVLLTSDAVWQLQVCALGSQPGCSLYTSCVYFAANLVQVMRRVVVWSLKQNAIRFSWSVIYHWCIN
jgi:hypothetical protein